MPTEFFYVVLLLVVAIIFGYFYLKRAQGRVSNTPPAGAPAPPSTPAETSAPEAPMNTAASMAPPEPTGETSDRTS